MKYIVVGAGYVGGRVLAQLPVATALGFSRSGSSSGDCPVRKLDLDDPGAEPLSLPGQYRLLYTVAPASDSGRDRRLARMLRLLEPLPERFVYISTSGVYGDCAGKLVNEEQAVNPCSDRARRRVDAEGLLVEWSRRQGVKLLVLRVPAIYGAGRLGIERIRAGTPIIAEAEAGPGNRIHVDDLAACCVAALTSKSAEGIYNTGDGDHRSSSWFSRCVARAAGLKPPPEVSREVAERTFREARLSFLRESRRLDNTRMRLELRPALKFADPEEGIRCSLPERG